MIPVQQLQGLARMWVQWRPIIGWGAKLARQKIPAELDDALTAIAGGNPNAVQNLQTMAEGQQPGQPGEIPEPKIGQPVMANDEARLAWYLTRVQGYSYREAQKIMAEQYDCNVAVSTVKNYADRLDAEDAEELQLRRMARYKSLFFFTLTGIGFGLLGFFLERFLRF